MKEITIAFKQPQVRINGLVFDVLMSDGDILDRSLELAERYEGADVTDVRVVKDIRQDYENFISAVLGDGALDKLRGSKPVFILQLQDITVKIAAAASAAYDDYVNDSYDDASPEFNEEAGASDA